MSPDHKTGPDPTVIPIAVDRLIQVLRLVIRAERADFGLDQTDGIYFRISPICPRSRRSRALVVLLAVPLG